MSHRRQRRHQSGLATAGIVLSIVILMLAGGWNYNRNLQSEQAIGGSRPYLNYADGDLESLRDAYAQELVGVRANYDAAKRSRARGVRDVGSIAGNVDQFQNTTRKSSAIRNAAAGVVENQGRLEEIDRELEIRSQLAKGFARHLKRLIGL